MVEHIDIIGKTIGNFGKWQLRTILIIFLCKIPTSWFMAIVIYTAPLPAIGEYYCRPPASTNKYSFENLTEWIQTVHPQIISNEDNRTQTDYCHVYKNVMDNPQNYFHPSNGLWILTPDNHVPNDTDDDSLIPCPDFAFVSDFHSIIDEFNLVCSRSVLLSLTQSFHILGLLIGGVMAYIMLKYISPRHVMLTGMVAQMFTGNAAGLVRVYELHVLFRCLSASTCALMYTSGQMILADITGGKAKILTSIIFELFWSIGLILLPALSIFFVSWSQLYMAISMPTVLLIFLHRNIPDSPRWLLRNGQIEETKEIILNGAKTNRLPIAEDIDYLLRVQSAAFLEEPAQAGWWSLWDGNPRRRHLLAVHYAWAMYILLFNSMVLNIRAYGREHIHINTVVIGFSEMFGVFIGMYLILYTRRRWLWTGLFSIVAGGLAYLTWFIPDNLKKNNIVALEMIPCIAIKMATSSSLSILTTCTADLVVMEKKKTLMLSASIWARGWFLWAPFISLTKKYGTLVPLNIFATLAVIGGILTSIINHSHHKNHKKKAQILKTAAELSEIRTARRNNNINMEVFTIKLDDK